MAKDKIPYHQLPEDACLNEQQLYGYMDGTLSYKEQHSVEKHLLDCDFCSDALAGLELVKDRSKIAALPLAAAVQPQNGEPVSAKKEKGRIIPFYRSPRSYAAAAALILLLAVTWYFKGLTGSDENKQLSDNTTISQEAPAEEKSGTAMADSMMVSDADAQQQKLQREKDQPEKTEQVTTLNRAENSPAPVANADMTKFTLESGVDNKDPVKAKEAEKGVASGKQTAPGERVVADGDFIALEDASISKDELKKEEANRAADKNVSLDVVANGGAIRVDSTKALLGYSANGALSPVTTNATLSQTTGASTYQWSSPDTLSLGNTTFSTPASAGVYETETIAAKKNSGYLFSKNDAYKKSKSSKPVPSAASETQPNTPQTDNEKYNRALTEINGNRNESALLILNDILKNPASPLYPDAQWQKAVVLLKLNKKAEAKVILQEIVKKGGKYKPLAESQLKQL